jgi:hypothetical protein
MRSRAFAAAGCAFATANLLQTKGITRILLAIRLDGGEGATLA